MILKYKIYNFRIKRDELFSCLAGLNPHCTMISFVYGKDGYTVNCCLKSPCTYKEMVESIGFFAENITPRFKYFELKHTMNDKTINEDNPDIVLAIWLTVYTIIASYIIFNN